MPIETEEQLREIYGTPSDIVLKKQLTHLEPHSRRFIGLSPFVLVATSDGVRLDVSPRGDKPGFVQIETEQSLLLPDWPGNKRVDGLRNILKHNYVGLIFLIPNVRETLRVNGTASIHVDANLLERFQTDKGRKPLTVLRIHVEEVFLHCAKAFLRSNLWEPDSWPERSALPTLAEMIRDQTKVDVPQESDADMVARYRKKMWG